MHYEDRLARYQRGAGGHEVPSRALGRADTLGEPLRDEKLLLLDTYLRSQPQEWSTGAISQRRFDGLRSHWLSS